MSFLRGTSITFLSNIGVGFISLLFAILLSRMLGAEGKGLVALLFVVPSLVAMVLDAGVSIDTIYSARKRSVSSEIIYSNNISWVIIIGLVSWLATAGILLTIDASDQLGWINIAISSSLTPLLIYVALQRNLLLGIGNVVSYNTNSILQLVIVLACAFCFFLLIEANVYHAMIAYLLSFLIVLLHAEKRLNFSYKGFDFNKIKASIKYGFMGHLGTVIQYLNYRLDVIVLAYYTDAQTVGIYSVSYTCAEVLWRLPRAVGVILFPSIAELSAEKATQLTNVVFKITAYILIVLCGLAAVVGYYSIGLVFGDEFNDSVGPFLLLLPGVFFFSWHNTLVEDLKGRGMPIAKLYTAGIALVFTLIGDFILIPSYSMHGAAMATSIAYFVAGGASIYLYCRKTNTSLGSLIFINRSEINVLTGAGKVR